MCCNFAVRFNSLLTRARLRRLFFLTFLWSSVCYVVFHVSHNPRTDTFINTQQQPLISRELLQQAPDYNQDGGVKSQQTLYPDANLNVDKTTHLTEKEMMQVLSRNSNLPFNYWAKLKSRPTVNDSCSKFPSLYELDFNNIYWQRLEAKNATFYLYGAYFDDRPRVGRVPVVRILAMVDKVKPPQTFCQLWYDSPINGKPYYFSQATYTYMWYTKWGNYIDGQLQPYIISCLVPSNTSYSSPASMSLVEHPCDSPRNNLRVVNNRPEKKQDFAVCVKGLDFLYDDISLRLVEWIELLNILGAKKIFFYELEIHPNISKVLDYYAKRGIVELTPITLPGNLPNLPGFRHLYLRSKVVNKRQNELIPYNDCLYKNLHSYDYLALLDTDEVIMPLVHDNWKEMMQGVVKLSLEAGMNYTRASYNFRNVYFLDDLLDGEEANHRAHEEGIPKYLHMLQHVYRSSNYTKPFSYVKCFHNVDRAVSLHNHFPLNCFGQCTTYSVNTTMAHMQHYRKDCVGSLQKICKDYKKYTTRDVSIWKYKDELIRRTTKALSEMGFFKITNQVKIKKPETSR